MTKKLEKLLKEIVKENPQIDIKAILEQHAVTQTSRSLGRRRREYKLILPTSRRQVRVLNDRVEDRRAICLMRP
jgi:hypothetical protein